MIRERFQAWLGFFLVLPVIFLATFPAFAGPAPNQRDRVGVGELQRLLALHPIQALPEDFPNLEGVEEEISLEGGAPPTRFYIPAFDHFGCGKCHPAKVLLHRAAARMRDVMNRLRTTLPEISRIPLRQYIIQPWANELLFPRQLAHTTFDTIRVFPGTILIDDKVYGRATHLHESLHLTQSFLGPANELEAYGLNIRSDPRFLLLNFPFFSDVVRGFFVPDFRRILDSFYSRPVKENLKVPREVQWFMREFDPGSLNRLARAVQKMEPLLTEVSRLNREYPLRASYLSEQTGNASLLLEIAAVKLLSLPANAVTADLRSQATAIFDTQMRKSDNTRLGYKIDRKKEALLTLKHQLKLRDPRERLSLYFHYLKGRFIGPGGEVRLVIEDGEDYLAFIKRKLGQIEKMAASEKLTPLERQAAETLARNLRR
ncbi:MAG: hypothetical protein ACE5E9_11670 [Nitrospinaceae bacterium]